MAALVLGTALVALVRMLNLGRLSADADHKRVVALQLLRREVEVLRVRGYEPLEAEAEQPIPDNNEYTRSVAVVPDGDGLKRVTVTVHWDSPTGSRVSESLEFMAADSVLPMRTFEVP